jgi:hypothetical protein
MMLELPTVISIEIESNRFEFTDRATVRFSEGFYKQNNKISDLIKRNDRIVIYLGYFAKRGLIQEFNGYISEVIPGKPCELKCQDEMYILKQHTIEPKVFEDTNLKELLTYYYKGQTSIDNVNIGTWVVGLNSTLVDLFDELRSTFGMLTYFKNSVLCCNAELITSPEKTVIFNVQENVPVNGVDIKIQNDDEAYKLIVHGISPQKDGSKFERYAYYTDNARTIVTVSSIKPDGVLNVVKIPEITQIELDNLIKRRLPKLYESTAAGEALTFGLPSFKHSDRAQIIDVKNPSNEGIYDIIGVSKTYGISTGYKQKAKLGLKIQ